jgi:hypothetical protein
VVLKSVIKVKDRRAERGLGSRKKQYENDERAYYSLGMQRNLGLESGACCNEVDRYLLNSGDW